ncbi:MAG: hypothetical protein KBF73_00690 [Flavobacteriales bacterium]|nr:hypothetical protein [Flavobacteriales bacterium]
MSENRILDTDETKELGRKLLFDGHQVRFKLGGNSMFPYLRDGEVAVTVRVPTDQLKAGQVIVFEQNDRWIAHRLVGLNQTTEGLKLVAQGDSITRPDRPISEAAYLGVIIGYSRNGKQYKVDSSCHLVYGRIMSNLSPFPQFLIRLFLRIRNRLRRF